ncbi:MAG TPA: hypothetical protein PLE99_11535 [Candidatus Thiothrix moscowensis]|uniref:hypothetical protein n=1 Tax=unclassified Thiothrix TaxID=2636184 RepID=UPI001A308B1E|nr:MULTISPECIES: hypothetical protein [unclassified Thiothrix]MBJ6609056.1 hypothetical protein [Candidatus Thiothrix moscowensis]HRJ53391.1 hypothetical protein [Candidatus Thiothrix moscowensis]HRJ94632.1 hypothetical protein [Candidatus Thiothrix moscowensis]
MNKVNFLTVGSRVLWGVAAGVLLSGCSSVNGLLGSNGSLTADPQQLADYTANQEGVYQELLKLSGLQAEPVNSAEWQQFILAGVQHANDECEQQLVDKNTGNAQTRPVIHSLQQQYADRLMANQYDNRVAAMTAIQGYRGLCLPGNIETAMQHQIRITQPSKGIEGGMNLIPQVVAVP